MNAIEECCLKCGCNAYDQCERKCCAHHDNFPDSPDPKVSFDGEDFHVRTDRRGYIDHVHRYVNFEGYEERPIGPNGELQPGQSVVIASFTGCALCHHDINCVRCAPRGEADALENEAER